MIAVKVKELKELKEKEKAFQVLMERRPVIFIACHHLKGSEYCSYQHKKVEKFTNKCVYIDGKKYNYQEIHDENAEYTRIFRYDCGPTFYFE
jgi:hypothetical protein